MEKKVKIFTEITSDLTSEYIKENNIGIIPIYYHFDEGIIYGDEINLSKDEFYLKMKDKKPKTIGCNPEKIYSLFKEALNEGYEILCIMFSGALSVGYSSALLAKQMIEEEFDNPSIEIVNSKRGSLSEGYMVKEAIRLLKQKMNLKSIKEYLDSHIENFKCLFSVYSLDYLIKSGRVSHLKGMIGNVLNLKPIFSFDEEGKLYSLGNKRGLKKVIKEISEDIKNFKAKEVTISHANNLELAKEIKEYIENDTNINCEIVDLNFSVVSNTGEGSFGVSYYK